LVILELDHTFNDDKFEGVVCIVQLFPFCIHRVAVKNH